MSNPWWQVRCGERNQRRQLGMGNCGVVGAGDAHRMIPGSAIIHQNVYEAPTSGTTLERNPPSFNLIRMFALSSR